MAAPPIRSTPEAYTELHKRRISDAAPGHGGGADVTLCYTMWALPINIPKTDSAYKFRLLPIKNISFIVDFSPTTYTIRGHGQAIPDRL